MVATTKASITLPEAMYKFVAGELKKLGLSKKYVRFEAYEHHDPSGECGWCHSRLISGDVYIPEGTEYHRAADKKFGYIHPCCSFPISDLEIEVPYAK